MNVIESQEDIWHSFDDFEVPEDRPQPCRHAEEFALWADELLERTDMSNQISVNQAKVQLLDKYFDFFALVPKSHRYCVGTRSHICIFHVFKLVGDLLQAAELKLHKPELFKRLKQVSMTPARPIPHYNGIILGEVLDGETLIQD